MTLVSVWSRVGFLKTRANSSGVGNCSGRGLLRDDMAKKNPCWFGTDPRNGIYWWVQKELVDKKCEKKASQQPSVTSVWKGAFCKGGGNK